MRALIAVMTGVLVASGTSARADGPSPSPSPPVVAGPESSLTKRIAVWRFDALGIDPALVAQLEALFRNELGRLDTQPMLSRREIERLAGAELVGCTGEEKCLAAIGKKASTDVVVTGTVSTLGDNYVLDVKAVDVATGKLIQRTQSDPLRGSPDDLIEGVRVAAYKLLAPDQIHGAIQIQGDLIGAKVVLDDKSIGAMPLPNGGVLSKQTLGKHKLHVEAAGYSPFDDTIDVHFQKVAPVIVRLIPSTVVIGTGKTVVVDRHPWYSRTWVMVGLGVVAVGLGAAAYHHHGTVCATNDPGRCE